MTSSDEMPPVKGASAAIESRELLDKLIRTKELPFHEFVELVLYDPGLGYYARGRNPVGREADFVTSGAISPVFGFALERLAEEFVECTGDGLCGIVDIGCGDGSLLASIAGAMSEPLRSRVRFLGIDRTARSGASAGSELTISDSLDSIPSDLPLLVLSNELFDALPFARVVRREEGLRELWVRAEADPLEWSERDAPPELCRYFEDRGIELELGQFADISPGWGELYTEICRRVERGLIVTFDYGYRQERLFDPRVRRFGTAAAYRRHQVSRDLLRDPGEQDLTAHVNFSDLITLGEAAEFETLELLRQAELLLRLGIAEHPLFQPLEETMPLDADLALQLREERELARRLVLPDGIGQEISVLVQAKGVPSTGWSFQRRLW